MARSTVSGRVSKRTASSVAATSSSNGTSTRQRSRLAASSSSNVLQDMVDEATYGLSSSTGLSQAMEDVQIESGGGLQSEEMCPITDKDERPFPLMLLPAEIRNEIYRACLTRPFNVVLSKRETAMPAAEGNENEEDVQDGGEGEDMEKEAARIQVLRQNNERALILARAQAVSSTTDGGDTMHGRSIHQASSSVRSVWANRNRRPVRLPASRTSSSSSSVPGGSSHEATGSDTTTQGTSTRPRSRRNKRTPKTQEVPRKPLPQDADPLLINILRTSKTVYQEARSILYSENMFTLDLDTAHPTLVCLHQRSRRQIKYVEVEIPCYNEILERFQETVRLSLRYCWGLKTLVIHMPFVLPGSDGSTTSGNTTVYANGFDILRWLPRQCEVVLRGNVATEIEAVVSRNANLAKTLDELAYARRQLISNETERTPGP